MAEFLPVPDPQPKTARDTYRYLRVGMPLIIVGLAAAVAIEASSSHCLKTSISAYYYAPVHSIFIAALCALGALLIIYKGVCDSEDALLSVAGVLAFFVAMVPTPRNLKPHQHVCGSHDLPDVCGKHDLPKDYTVADGVTNNVWAVVIALVAVQAFALLKYYRTNKDDGQSADDQSADGPSCGGILVRAFLWAVFGAGVIALQFRNSQFLAYGHYAAALTMFGAVILTVGITALVTGYQDESLSPHKRGYQLWYSAIAIAMVATVIFVWQSHKVWPHWIIFVEAMLILEFAVYWITQTIELWKTQNRIALLREHERNLLLARCTKSRREPLRVGITREQSESPGKRDTLLRLL